MFARIRLVVLAATMLSIPSLATAQGTLTPDTARMAGPTVDATATAFRVQPQPADSASLALQRQNVGRPVALMVVGGAAILVGAVIGDAPGALFMIGGAVAFLYGLYQYLQ